MIGLLLQRCRLHFTETFHLSPITPAVTHSFQSLFFLLVVSPHKCSSTERTATDDCTCWCDRMHLDDPPPPSP